MDITSQDMQEMQDLAEKFNIDIKPMQGELTCVFVGQWNAAKSSLLNSLFAMPLLPEGVKPTTKTVVSLAHGTTSETTASIYTKTGGIESYQGQAATEALQRATEDLPRIDYRSNKLDMPANTLFVDTPGFNDTDITTITKAETITERQIRSGINDYVKEQVDKCLNDVKKDIKNQLDELDKLINENDLDAMKLQIEVEKSKQQALQAYQQRLNSLQLI